MLRVLEAGVVGVGTGLRAGLLKPLTLGFVTLGGALAPLVLRARRKAALARAESVEVARLDIGGAGYGAVYEDGRLVGVLEGVDRL